MNTNASNQDPRDPLWDLLGKAKVVEVSPFFARNVLREIRLAQTQTQTIVRPSFGWAPALLQRWRMALAACAVACVVAATATVLFQGQGGTLALRSGDAEVISNLDELLAYEGSTVWVKKHSF